MSITLYSVSMAVVLSTGFALVTHLFRKKDFFLRSFGIPMLLFLYGVCLFRLAFPMEFPFTRPVSVTRELQGFLHLVRLETIPVGETAVSPLHIAVVIWLAGALVAFACFGFQYFHSLKKVWALESLRPPGPQVEEALLKVQNESGRKIPVTVCQCPGVGIPYGVGIFKKWILLPDRELSDSELFYILKHEYTHFRSHDLAIKMLVVLFCCIFWWNPAVYLLQNDIGEMLELRCDRACTASFSKKQKVEYLTVLAKQIEEAPENTGGRFRKLKARFHSKSAASLFQRKNNLSIKERFRLISKPITKGCFWGQALVMGIFIVLLVLSYLFVVQPRYEPPMNEIVENSQMTELIASDEFILKDKNGNYFLVTGGEHIPINATTADIFLADGTKIEEE